MRGARGSILVFALVWLLNVALFVTPCGPISGHHPGNPAPVTYGVGQKTSDHLHDTPGNQAGLNHKPEVPLGQAHGTVCLCNTSRQADSPFSFFIAHFSPDLSLPGTKDSSPVFPQPGLFLPSNTLMPADRPPILQG